MPSSQTSGDAGSPISTIDEILDELRQGKMVILVDDEDRENEGDLICPAQAITPEIVNFMLTYGRGTLCVALSQARCKRLHLSPQVTDNTTRLGTNFTVTVEMPALSSARRPAYRRLTVPRRSGTWWLKRRCRRILYARGTSIR